MGKRKEKSTCLNCQKEFHASYTSFGKYCSNKCQFEYSAKEIFKRIENGEQLRSRYMKKYLIHKYGEKCLNPDCGWDWSKYCRIELEHKDGNSTNNELSNLTLLCPNCHSNTSTYGNKNRGNGRKVRRQRYQEGKSY